MTANREESVVVACAANRLYALPLAVMLRSAACHLGEGRRLTAFVVDDGIPPGDKQRVADSMPANASVSWIRPVRDNFDGLPLWGRMPITTYDKLMVADFLPADVHRAIWLDCDMLVLRSLRELFAKLDGGPVFTPENKAPHLTANSPELYDLMPIARSFDRNVPMVNGGVSGWRRGRDDAALDAYIAPIAAGARDERILAAIRWHDQGALIWAIQSLGLEDRVLDDARWNLCIDHVNVASDLLQWDDHLAARLREALPDVGIVHWNGRPVPWTA